MRTMIALALLGSVARAESSACEPRHQACEAAHKKATEATGENPEDFQQMKLACDAAENCQRAEMQKKAKAADDARAKRDADQRAEYERRDGEYQARNAAEDIARQKQIEDAEQAKALRRPVAYSVAICAYAEQARTARPLTVTYRSGQSYDVSREDLLRASLRLAKRMKRRAAVEHVKLSPCRDIRKLAHCALQHGEGCEDDSTVDDAVELMDDVVTSNE